MVYSCDLSTRRMRLEDHQLKANLGCIAIPCLKNKPKVYNTISKLNVQSWRQYKTEKWFSSLGFIREVFLEGVDFGPCLKPVGKDRNFPVKEDSFLYGTSQGKWGGQRIGKQWLMYWEEELEGHGVGYHSQGVLQHGRKTNLWCGGSFWKPEHITNESKPA